MKREKKIRFLSHMKKKLFVLFGIIVVCLIIMIGRLTYIEVKSGGQYEKIVLSNQEYDSTTIPFRRGDIVDRKGTLLAISTDAYNVILDCSVINSDEDYLEPTIDAVVSCFEEAEPLDEDQDDGERTGRDSEEEIRDIIKDYPDSKYRKIGENIPSEEMQAFEEMADENSDIAGIWFEKEYARDYPYGSLASAVIGYCAPGNDGQSGIEESYDDVLNGTDGRQYGYLNSDSNYEVNIREAVNGENVVSTIDANLQTIVESKMKEFYEEMSNNARNGGGAERIAVLMMAPDSGEVLSMAEYPDYDYTLSSDENLELYYSGETISDWTDEERKDALDSLKQNYCITNTYEPGSTAKPFTIGCGLDTGTLTEDMTFYCDGGEQISDYMIHCVNRSGHGEETISEAMENSCNDALMQMSYKIGPENFARYQQLFNFGLKTNIDLPGETRTDALIYPEEELTTINLATNAFGQNFNVTMIQLASAYASIVNGGNYYLPHVVREVEDEEGNTVESIEPTLLKRTVSEDTAATLRQYMSAVIEQGTGTAAKVDGYSMCGKTGTAEKYILDESGNATSQRSEGNYLVSFIGSVPEQDPEVLIYCVVDEPNASDQAHSTYAQNIAREILVEALPYLNIYPDQELTGANSESNITGTENQTSAGE